jgi:RNA polymerase sigma-70 factor (ECF subfamily)
LEERLEALLAKYGAFLRRTIVHVCPSSLGIQFDDVEQEARLRLWRALKAEREIANPASYLYSVAVTATIDAVRRVKARREEQLDSAREGVGREGASPERAAEHQRVLEKIEQVLSGLPDDRHRPVALYLQGFGTREIGDLLGWSEAKARNLTYRGLNDLRARLKAEGIECDLDD